jgi:hypothetical protein
MDTVDSQVHIGPGNYLEVPTNETNVFGAVWLRLN